MYEKYNSIPNFSGKKILVVGLGLSGIWTVRWLAGHGASITASDTKPERDIDSTVIKELRELEVTLETGGHKAETFLGSEMIIISPGVSNDMDLLLAAKKRGVPVIGELEFAGRLIDTPIIAVTGTNGKSTVTTFMGLLLENAGFKVFIGGNIGTPLMAHAAGGKKADYAVIEVSSFQLDTIETFCPFVSVILNISPDHLDRYNNYESYVQSKLRIFENQVPGQYLIINDDDERLCSIDSSQGVSVLRYGIEEKVGRNAFIRDKRIRVCLDGLEDRAFSFEAFVLPGRHNLENLLALMLAGMTLGIVPEVIQKTVDQFKGLPNRLEQTSEVKGVLFCNDSKATNVDAAVRAIASIDRPLILICGGRHKGADYSPLVRAAQGKVKRAIFLGEARGLLAKSFEGILPFSMAGDMEEAVSISFSFAKRGDCVLLAPACSSFDMFSDYSHRGRIFRDAVERLCRD